MKFLKHQAAHLQEKPHWTMPFLAHLKLVRQSFNAAIFPEGPMNQNSFFGYNNDIQLLRPKGYTVICVQKSTREHQQPACPLP